MLIIPKRSFRYEGRALPVGQTTEVDEKTGATAINKGFADPYQKAPKSDPQVVEESKDATVQSNPKKRTKRSTNDTGESGQQEDLFSGVPNQSESSGSAD